MRKEMNSAEFKNRYSSFLPDYAKGSTAQQARTTLQEFNVTMGELGMTVLPAVNGGLKDLKAVLEGLRGILPGTSKPGAGTKIATRVGEGAVVGGILGAFGGPGGVLGGAAAGGVVGGALGVAEQYIGTKKPGDPGPLGSGVIGSVAALAQYAQTTNQALVAALNLLKSDGKHETAGERYERRIGKHAGDAAAAPQAKLAPLALTINLDGRTLAQAMSNSWYSFPTQAPDRIIRNLGLPHATLTLRTITESEGNQGALIADIIEAVSDVIRLHPRWANLGLAWLEAFDKINLASIRRAAKATGAAPLHSAVMVLLWAELERLLRPSKLPKPAKMPKVKREPKPPASLSRVPGVERNIDLGLRLLALRSTNKSNCTFGRAVRRQFDIDGQRACEVMKVARVYGARPEIFTRLSWNALLHLASPALSAAARDALESRIVAGERIGAPEIRAARGALWSGRPRHQPDQRAQRMAA